MNFCSRIIKKFENEYTAKSENANQDLLNISSLQTSVHELQSEIHEANEQQVILWFRYCMIVEFSY